jgi:KDO2-lipid IV(A) lauroyltransferase
LNVVSKGQWWKPTRRKYSQRLDFQLAVWLLWNISRALPFSILTNLFSIIGRVFASVFTRQHNIRANLAHAFPERPPEWIKQTAFSIASNFCRSAAELFHLDRLHDDLTFSSSDHQQLARFAGKPLIFVGAHLGSWELIPLFLSKKGIPLTIIYTKLGAPYIDKKLLKIRQLTGATYVEKTVAVRSTIQSLSQGRSVAMLVDQRVPSGVEVQFFQQNSIVTNLPARLALRFNSPIVPVSIERLARKQFHIKFDEAITVPDEPQTNAEQMMTQKMINSIEQMIRRSPETWFCNKRRWKGTTADV